MSTVDSNLTTKVICLVFFRDRVSLLRRLKQMFSFDYCSRSPSNCLSNLHKALSDKLLFETWRMYQRPKKPFSRDDGMQSGKMH